MESLKQPGLEPEKKEQSQAVKIRCQSGAEGGKKVYSTGGLNSKTWKKRPRGRPWPKGVSGNPQGRPQGARNHFSLAVAEGARRAAEELAKPKQFDRGKPYECWDGYLIQEGLLYDWDTEELLPGQELVRKPPRGFDPSQRCTEMTWKGKEIIVQNGWAFDPRTWRRLKM